MTPETEQKEGGGSGGWNRISLIVTGVGVAALLAAGALFFLTFAGILGNGDGWSGPGTATTFGGTLPPPYRTPQPSPTPAGTPPSEAPIARILIPRFGVDAPVIVMGVDKNAVMESPEDPCDVAWYDFTGRPGFGSNSVFSGHVDWHNVGSGCAAYREGKRGGAGPAVFYHLKDLVQGDAIELRLEDGTVYRYQVATRQQIDPDNADVGTIVGPTEQEVVTLITCGGDFDHAIGHYTQRVVVRAERIVDESPEGAQPGAAVAP